MSDTSKCSSTDQRQLVEFLRNQRPALLALCRRWCGGNSADADDLLGDACLRAFEALSETHYELASPLGWWATIIANVARDRARKYVRRHRASAELTELWSGAPSGDGASIDERLGLSRSLERVQARMSRLARTQRLAVTFRSFGDEYDEIARKLGTSNDNARKLVQMGRRSLRSDCRQLLVDCLDAGRASAAI